MTIARTTNPRYSTAFRKASLPERFHRSYEKRVDGCWEWIGALHVTGYGIIQSHKVKFLSHRVSWNLHFDNCDGQCVLHKCDNRKCVNPDHLFLGNRVDNNRDRDSKGRGPQGERNWCAKLKEEDIPVIRSLFDTRNRSQKELATLYNVSQGTISQVVNRITWTHIKG